LPKTHRMYRLALFTLLAIIIGTPGIVHGGDDDGIHWIEASSGCKAFVSHPAAELTVSWSGTCANGYAEGEGKLIWSNGTRFEGEVHGGIASGKGKYYWANGDWYEGDFREGHRDGVGTQYFGCAGRYQGTFHAGVIDGVGTFYLANGDRYEGDVSKGKMEGVGTLYLAHGNRYEGSFHLGVVEGLGTMYFANGSRYEGDFRSGQQDGLGTLFEPDGTIYEGGFKADRPEGQAVVDYASGDRYQGAYFNGHAEGRGIYTKANGERDVATFKERRGELALVSRIGLPLYKPCRDFCNASIAGCSAVVGSMSPMSQPGQSSPGFDRYGQCANETSQCVETCKVHNPSAGDVRGTIEIGPLRPSEESSSAGEALASQERKGLTPEAKTNEGSGELPGFTLEQAAATATLRASLERQRRELVQLKQQVLEHRRAVVAPAAPSSEKCGRVSPPAAKRVSSERSE
jgi:hypothetical protein